MELILHRTDFTRKPASCKSSLPRIIQLLTYSFIGLFLFLCIVNLFYQRPLWNDEFCVFVSIKAFSSYEMFHKPLLHVQTFPRVYLWIIQHISKMFNYELWSLRVLPFFAMIGAFFMWLKIAHEEFKGGLNFFVFVLSWCASDPLLYYSGELKQYSMDVLVGSVFFYFLIHQAEFLKKKNWAVPLIFLPLLGFFSYPAFIFMCLVLYNNLILLKHKEVRLIQVLSFAGAVITVYCLANHFDMRFYHQSVVDSIIDYFVRYDNFGEFIKSAGEGILNLFGRFVVERPRELKHFIKFFMLIGFVFMFVAFGRNFKKDRHVLKSLSTLSLALFIVLFVLGSLRKYPFTIPRASLFFAPLVLYLAIRGIGALKEWNVWVYRFMFGIYILLLLYVSMALSIITVSGELTAQPMVTLDLFKL